MRDIPIIPGTVDSSDIFCELVIKYHLSHKLKGFDALIASVCLSRDLPLFTFNKKDFSYIPKLRLVKHELKPKKIPFWQ